MKFVLSIVALLAIFAQLSVADDVSAKLLLIKEIEDEIITEGNELTVKYTLFNVGDGPATNVEVADSDFHDSDFEAVSTPDMKFERVDAGSNVSASVVVVPLKSTANFNFTSAVVQYVAAEGAEPTFGFSNEVGQRSIISAKEYKRAHASHKIEWFLFCLWCTPSLLLPYLVHLNSKNKYTLNKKSN